MPRWTDRNDAWDDEPEDDDWPDDDGYPDDDEPTVPCPYCGREIHEESPRCPYCGNYLSAADAPPAEAVVVGRRRGGLPVRRVSLDCGVKRVTPRCRETLGKGIEFTDING